MDKSTLSRRKFIKTAGAASAAAGVTGLGFFGKAAGEDPVSYTGTETFQGDAGIFNRALFEVDKPHYEKVGASERIDARTDVIFLRFSLFMRGWNEKEGMDKLHPVLKEFYRQNPEDLKHDIKLRNEIFPSLRSDSRKYREQFLLAKAWSGSMEAVHPEKITSPPEESDFPRGMRYGEPETPLKMKDPAKTSELIKKMSYEFGSVLTGITKLNPDWVYKYPMENRGFEHDKPFDIPGHWTYAIVVGTPMSWDPFLANPNYGTSHDAYSKSQIVAFRLASFIRKLGYPARPHTPGMDYDLIVPPIVIDAGLGEQGRHGVVVTPELGSNFRPAVITTSLPMKVDKPIDFGVQEFCKHCMICADNCPSGAISKGGKEVVRGYERYHVDVSKCRNFWFSNLGNIGCRLCVATCPYSRKSNWAHRGALHASSVDPTGLSHRILTWFQKLFYPGPKAQDYYMPALGGKNASYREAPWWLKSEDFIDF